MSVKLEKIKQLVGFGFKLFAVAPNKKTPSFQGWQSLATDDAVKLNDVYSKFPELNIGISIGDSFIAIDCDVKDGLDGVKDLEILEMAYGKLPETYCQNTPSGGKHFVFQTHIAVSNSVKKIADGIDVRGRGGFIVASGSSIHGAEYTDNGKPVARAPDWLVQKCQAASEKTKTDSTSDQELDQAILTNIAENKTILADVIQKAEEYLSTLPEVYSGSRNNAAYIAAAKLHDFGVPEDTAAELMLANFKSDPPMPASELKIATKNAYKYSRNFAGSSIDSAHSLNSMLENMNSLYGYIYHGKKEYVIYKKPNGDVIWYTPPAFHNNVTNTVDVNGAKKKISKIWFEWEKRGKIETLISSPWPLGQDPLPIDVENRVFNLWSGWNEGISQAVIGASAKHKAVEMWRDHLLKNVVNGVKEHAEWTEAWFANILQKPRQKPGTTLVIRGLQGTGKNTLFETFGYNIIGRNFAVVSHTRHLLGNFNSMHEGKLLMSLDEAFWSGAHDAASVLKALITEQEVVIERKGFEPYKVESNLRVGVIGNAHWMVDVPIDDRRFAIFNIGNGRKKDTTYFQALHDVCKTKEGAAALGRYLLDLDTRKIDLKVAPITEAKQYQMVQSLTIAQDWFCDSVFDGKFLGTRDFEENENGWKKDSETLLNIDSVYEMIARYANGRNIRSRVPKKEVILQDLQSLCSGIKMKKRGAYQYISFPAWHVCNKAVIEILGEERRDENE
jgi:hypothetical protein